MPGGPGCYTQAARLTTLNADRAMQVVLIVPVRGLPLHVVAVGKPHRLAGLEIDSHVQGLLPTAQALAIGLLNELGLGNDHDGLWLMVRLPVDIPAANLDVRMTHG